MFVDFEDPTTGGQIAINSDHIRAIRPGRSKATTVLYLSDDLHARHQEVKGEYRNVLDKLNGNKTLTLLPCPRGKTTKHAG